jgi:hypothetical protein
VRLWRGELNASGDCGIDDAGIAGLNLEKLKAENNPKITTVNHMTALKELDACWNCGIDDAGIAGLNLEKLYTYNNQKITPRPTLFGARTKFGVKPPLHELRSV